jgi:hypothetical protein
VDAGDDLAVAHEVTGADLERGIEIFSRVSESHGAKRSAAHAPGTDPVRRASGSRTSLLRGSRLARDVRRPGAPNLIAIGNEITEFGLCDGVHTGTLAFETSTHEPGEGWRNRTLELVSPNGYRVTLAGPSE